MVKSVQWRIHDWQKVLHRTKALCRLLGNDGTSQHRNGLSAALGGTDGCIEFDATSTVGGIDITSAICFVGWHLSLTFPYTIDCTGDSEICMDANWDKVMCYIWACAYSFHTLGGSVLGNGPLPIVTDSAGEPADSRCRIILALALKGQAKWYLCEIRYYMAIIIEIMGILLDGSFKVSWFEHAGFCC